MCEELDNLRLQDFPSRTLNQSTSLNNFSQSNGSNNNNRMRNSYSKGHIHTNKI